ncbi:hypothetical protein TREVI0001_2071 [Treponema vincentii ATCC 35580]|uniref:Uncharacterized protein n=1 Tax=Treponema vincentii ATCC 35580 TaxID=596324 RepID=C8PQG7_9SPIR|nr:hypothetical protein TREVI0001_2071 [Treponema vincentii ATCC 35580]
MHKRYPDLAVFPFAAGYYFITEFFKRSFLRAFFFVNAAGLKGRPRLRI